MNPALPDLDVVQQTVEEVRRRTAWANRLQVGLVAFMVAVIVASMTFTVSNGAKLRKLVENGDRDRDRIAALNQIVQDFNEEHARAAGESFETLNTSHHCMFNWMADYNAALANSLAGMPQPLPDRALLQACFRPTTPQPAPPPDPPKKEKP